MMKEVRAAVDRALAGVRQAYRGVIEMVSSDGPVQLVQVQGLADEDTPDVELFQQYGFTSNPPQGSQVVIVPLGGRTSHAMIVATEHDSRVTGLKSAEVALYTSEGDSIVMRNGRIIDITTKTLNINVETLNVTATAGAKFDTPLVDMTKKLAVQQQISGNGGMAVTGGDGVTVEGRINVDGTIDVTQDVTAGGKSVVHHKHPGDSGGTTGEPI